MTQGQSLSTLDKERQIAAMLDMNMQIVRGSCPGDIYRHIDLNAGSGLNEDCGGVPGSPLVFVQLAEEFLKDRWDATFYEIDAGRAGEMEGRLRGIPRCRVLALDNCSFVKQTLRRASVGSVLVDPNGWLYRKPDNGNGCPVREMIQFFAEHPRMDLIANLNLRLYKQMRGALNKNLAHYRDFYKLQEFRKLFHKQDGLISTRSSNGHTSFVRMILRNLRTREYRSMGWYHLDSPQALEVYRYAETTAAERNVNTDQAQLVGMEELKPDPNHPGKHIDPKTGIWPISEWGPECGRGLRTYESRRRSAKDPAAD